MRWVFNLLTFGGLLKLWRWWGNKVRTSARPNRGERFSWGRVATQVVKRPAAALLIGVLVFGALSAAVVSYQSAGFGGAISAPAGTDSAAGTDLMNKYFPSTAANPTNLVYKLSVPAWQDAAAIEKAATQLAAAKDVFTGVTGPLNPVGGTGFTPAEYTQLHALLGSGPLPATAPAEPAAAAAAGITAAQWTEAYQLYRATAQYVSADGKTIQFETSLTAGRPVDHGGAQRGSRGPYRGGHGRCPCCTPPTTAWRARRPPSTTSTRSPTATWRT